MNESCFCSKMASFFFVYKGYIKPIEKEKKIEENKNNQS